MAGATRMPGADSGGTATDRAKNAAASGSPNLSGERRRAVALRVEIDKEDALSMLRKIPGEVNGDRALSDAALLVVHDEHFHEAEALFGLGHVRFDESVANRCSGENKFDGPCATGKFLRGGIRFV